MRLYLLNKYKASSCYFIIVGKQNDFIPFFRSIGENELTNNIRKLPTNKQENQDLPQPQGFYTEWFAFKQNEVKTIRITNPTKPDYNAIYKAFLDKYSPKNNNFDICLPNTLTTKCVAISPLVREFPLPYVGGIWEIVSSNEQ